MADDSTITINQSLHGYKGGHKLLSTSVDLSDYEKRFMLLMSDYSGSGLERGFTEYLTGYPIPSSKFYVFAKTWYASEMNRPGCVWTHSLLIDVTDLWFIKNMSILIEYFKRPDVSSDQLEYSNVKEINPNSQYLSNALLDESFYKISCEIYSETNNGIVLLANTSTEFENEIMQIWSWQWPRMKRSFTFSTGSLSLRRFEDQPFDLQILPAKRERSVSIGERAKFSIVNVESLNCDNDWIDDYKQTDLFDLQKFMVKYGSDVTGERKNFVALFKSYRLLENAADLDVGRTKFLLESYFNDPSQGRSLKVSMIQELIKGNVDGLEFIELILKSEPLSGIKFDFNNIISGLYTNGRISSDELLSILNLLSTDTKYQGVLIDILLQLDTQMWLDKIQITRELCSNLVRRSKKFEEEKSIWQLDEHKRETWLEALKGDLQTNWFKIVASMLAGGSDLYAKEVMEISPDAVLGSSIMWVSESGERLPQGWFSVLLTSQQKVAIQLLNLKKLNKEVLRLFLDALSPQDVYWKDLNMELIQGFVSRILEIWAEPETTGVYTFFITACFDNNICEADNFTSLIFQPLHDNLHKEIYDFNSWERLKWDMGKEMYGLIQQSYWSYLWLDKNRVPDWDRCEFLRRALVVAFLKFRWNPLGIVDAVKDRNTFEKVVEFGIQVAGGYTFFESIYYELKRDRDNKDSFHYRVLKECLK